MASVGRRVAQRHRPGADNVTNTGIDGSHSAATPASASLLKNSEEIDRATAFAPLKRACRFAGIEIPSGQLSNLAIFKRLLWRRIIFQAYIEAYPGEPNAEALVNLQLASKAEYQASKRMLETRLREEGVDSWRATEIGIATLMKPEYQNIDLEIAVEEQLWLSGNTGNLQRTPPGTNRQDAAGMQQNQQREQANASANVVGGPPSEGEGGRDGLPPEGEDHRDRDPGNEQSGRESRNSVGLVQEGGPS